MPKKAIPRPRTDSVHTRSRIDLDQSARAPYNALLPTTRAVTLETALYLAIFVVALATRFYALGGHPLHHDESLHAFYSWRYYTGQGYTHDPMMHGPFQFHGIALLYFLFGANDATARTLAALLGLFVVVSPWLMRRQFGRMAALSAAFLLLISPSFLYYSRFARNDIYVAAWTMLLLVAVLGYLERPRRLHAYLGATALALLFSTKETFYITAFIFGTFFIIALAWQVSRRTLAGLCAYGAAALALLFVGTRSGLFPALPAIPVDQPTVAHIWSFTLQLLAHSLVWSLAGITVLALALIAANLRQEARQKPLLSAFPAGSLPYAVRALLADRATLFGAIGIFLAISVVLYTSFFSNLGGIATGSFGALGYWLKQQGVQRGNQPWYYYAVLVPLYEPLVTGIAGLAGIGFLWRLLRRRPAPLVEPAADAAETAPVSSSSWLIPLLLIYWLAGAWIIYSWAGEKMPWLMLHLVQPAILLAAYFVGTTVAPLFSPRAGSDGVDKAGSTGRRFLVGAAIVSGLLTWLTYLQLARFTNLPQPGPRAPWPMGVLAGPALALVALAVVGTRMGRRRALQALVTGIAVVGIAYAIHSAVALSYLNPATPVEMAVYVQTSPDVERVVGNIDRLSAALTGGKDLKVMYDSDVSWPFEWYLRDYRNRVFSKVGDTQPGPDVPIILAGVDSGQAERAAEVLTDYVGQRYVLRWWYPEDPTYRAYIPSADNTTLLGPGLPAQMSQLAGTVARLAAPAEEWKLWRYLLFRDPGNPLGSTDFYLYVRKDVLSLYRGLEE